MKLTRYKIDKTKVKKLLLILLFCVVSLNAKESETQAILQLNTRGHTALIHDIIVTKNGDIISASDDKTIRVWDSKTGKEKQEILGQIDDKYEGKVSTIALSSDEKYLAVGGIFGKYGHFFNAVRVYDYKTGKLIQLLRESASTICDVAFSKDGKYLINGNPDGTAKIWKKKNGKFYLQETIYDHLGEVTGVDIIQKGSNYYALTVGYDKKISLYDINHKKTLITKKLDFQLKDVAHNQNSIVVVGASNDILVLDFNLNIIKTIHCEDRPAGLKYSKDGKYLIVGASSYPNHVNIYETQTYSFVASFKKHKNTTVAVNFLDDHTAVSGGGFDEEIYIWDIRTKKIKKKIVGDGKRIWSVGIKGDAIAWGNSWDTPYGRSKFERTINLKNFNIGHTIFPWQHFNRIASVDGKYYLYPHKGGRYGYDDASLDIIKDGITQATITKNGYDGYRHDCFGWYKDLIISGGMNGMLAVYDKNASLIALLQGHTGEIWSIALDGDRLVSAGNQTIKVWDLSQIRLGKKKLEYDKAQIKKFMKDYNISRKIATKVIHDDNKMPQIIQPILTIFVSNDDEYVAYTSVGFFTASKGGEKYIGFHINQGHDKEAKYISADKFDDIFKRPDLVQKALDGKSIEPDFKKIKAVLDARLQSEVK